MSIDYGRHLTPLRLEHSNAKKQERMNTMARKQDQMKQPLVKRLPTSKEEMKVDSREAYYDKLKSREGYVDKVYADTLGHLTVGVGHKLTPEELEMYKEGDAWQGDLEGMFREDADKSYQAGLEQAELLGNTDPELVNALGHVSYQLGPNWNKIHKKTWGYLQQGEYEKAAKEAEDSKWFQQTPVRVRDFQNSLMHVAKMQKLNNNVKKAVDVKTPATSRLPLGV